MTVCWHSVLPANYIKLHELLSTVYAPIKEVLRLPATNMSAVSFTVPEDLVPVIKSLACRNYLKSLITYGTITLYKYVKIKNKLRNDYPDNAEQIITAMDGTCSYGPFRLF